MAKLKSGTRIYGTATIDTSVVVGSAVTANSSGIQVAGIVTATSFRGDGSQLTGVSATVSISTNTTNQAQFLTYAVSTGSTTGLGVTTSGLVFNPSNNSLGIGTTNPLGRLQVGTGTTTFIVTGTGSTALVGIGTTNPRYIFTVTDTGTPATTGLTNCLADFTTTANSYGQINLRNTSTGTNASADIIITADNGTDSSNFVDLGINNSGFSVGSWTINGTGDAYLYTSDTNLSIGAAAANKYLSFFTGGTLISNERMRITGIGSVGIGTTNPTVTLDVFNTTAATRTAIFTRGADNNFQLTAQNGTSSNVTGEEVARFGINYAGSGWNSFLQFIRGTGQINGSLAIYTNNTERVRIIGGGEVGIGTTNPSQTLHVQGNARVTGAVYDSSNSPGTSGQVLQSTVTGTQWTTAAAGGGGSGKFDTSIDNVLYVQPTGTLDIVGVGTTVTQITTLPASSPEYIIHSIHVTNISNGDAEVTAGFVINARKVPATISVSAGYSGGAGIHTFTVGSASSITVGMAVTGTGNIGETTGIGSTAGFQYNTYVTSVDGTNITLSKPMSGRATGILHFSPVSLVSSRLPVPVGSAVELLKQPMVLNALDSIVLQSTGAGSGIGTTSGTTITYTSGRSVLTVTGQSTSFFNSISAGYLVQNTGLTTGIQPNTFVSAAYTGISTSYAGTGVISIPITRPVNATVGIGTSLSFTEVVVPQDGALQATIVYQSSTDTAYQSGTGTVVGIVTLASLASSGITSTTPLCYYGTGNTYPSTVQSIRVSNISDGSIYPGGDYPVWVGIGNSDTVFSWLAYNMVVPKNSSIELCEAPKRLGIGQSIFAYSNTPGVIEIQVAAKQKTS